MADAAFDGFSPKFVQFLKNISKHNSREWFQANKAVFEEHVRSPFLAFVRAMQGEFDRFAPHVVADDRKVGGSMMRINRDTRF